MSPSFSFTLPPFVLRELCRLFYHHSWKIHNPSSLYFSVSCIDKCFRSFFIVVQSKVEWQCFVVKYRNFPSSFSRHTNHFERMGDRLESYDPLTGRTNSEFMSTRDWILSIWITKKLKYHHVFVMCKSCEELSDTPIQVCWSSIRFLVDIKSPSSVDLPREDKDSNRWRGQSRDDYRVDTVNGDRGSHTAMG